MIDLHQEQRPPRAVIGEPYLGFLDQAPDPLRYRHVKLETFEVSGLLVARVPRGARLLEVGCGTGALLQLLRDECGAEVVGVEPNQDRADSSREKGLHVVDGYYDDVTAAALGTFDVIVFADVLEHMIDPVPVLMRARHALRPGGVVLASLPNVAHWTMRWDLLRGRFDYEPYGLMDATHLRWFTVRGVQRLFSAAGFGPIDFDWTSGFWLRSYHRPPLSWIGSAAWRQRLVRRLVRVYPSVFGVQHIVQARSDP